MIALIALFADAAAQAQTSEISTSATQARPLFGEALKLSPFLKQSGFMFAFSRAGDKNADEPGAQYQSASGPSFGLRAEWSGFEISYALAVAKMVPESTRQDTPTLRGDSDDWRASYAEGPWAVEGLYQRYSGFIESATPGDTRPEKDRFRADPSSRRLRASVYRAFEIAGDAGAAFRSMFDKQRSAPKQTTFDWYAQAYFNDDAIDSNRPLFEGVSSARTTGGGGGAGVAAAYPWNERNWIAGSISGGPGHEWHEFKGAETIAESGVALAVDLKARIQHAEENFEYGATLTAESIASRFKDAQLNGSSYEFIAWLGWRI